MSTKINHEGVLLLEQPFLRIPYENYRKVFRTSQKYIERDLGAVLASANDLVQNTGKANGDEGGTNAEERNANIDAMIAKVEALKRKLADLHQSAGSTTINVMRQRINHLSTIEHITHNDTPEFDEWANTRLNRWIVDWALRKGYTATAEKITSDKHLEEFVDLDLFSEIHRVERALKNHSCAEALAWCSENKASLRKLKSPLEFELRLQEYIELARARKRVEAGAYARKHLAPWKDTQEHLIKHCAGLLISGPSSQMPCYKRLYSPDRWNTLIASFRRTCFTLNALPETPVLYLALHAGLASLKLPACQEDSNKNTDCPVCDSKGLGVLAKEVPWSHHVNSSIVCRLSGKIMNEDNPPMAFPDVGYVYSRDALKEMAAKNDNYVVCPRSKAKCHFNQLRKVFIT